MLEVWTEKYRPAKLRDIKGQPDVIFRLQAFVKAKSMPHLLFAGPAGVGKTCAAIAIAKELYGPPWRESILDLNASDERGIDVIRHKVKDFARTRAVAKVPFKLIYLDESDALTKEAQHALRRIMEDYTVATRFILACNYSSKIISPIQSRCAIFRFKPLDKDASADILKQIAKKEGLKLAAEAIDLIYAASAGDMRKAENILQACSSITKKIDKKAVVGVVSFAEPKEIAEVVIAAFKGQFKEAKVKLADIMIKYGLSGLDAIRQIQQQLWSLDIDEATKVQLTRACGEYEFRLVEGANEFIQLDALLADFALIGSKK